MTDKKSSGSRRKLLKSIAAGSGAVVAGKSLPESWSKPVVDAVILPTHAATTGDTPPAPTSTPAPAPTTTCNPSGVWSAQSSFNDGIRRDMILYDENFRHVVDNNGDSFVSLSTTDFSGLEGFSGYIAMGYCNPQQSVVPPVSTTLTVTTDCNSITVTQDVVEGICGGRGATTAMVKMTFPEGLLEEVNFTIPAP